MPIELEKFAWPGRYTLLYVFTQSREHLVLCHECATKAVNGIEQGDENYDGYSKEGSYINWEGESSWCDDCGVELPSEYGSGKPKQDARSKIEEILKSTPMEELIQYGKELGIDIKSPIPFQIKPIGDLIAVKAELIDLDEMGI